MWIAGIMGAIAAPGKRRGAQFAPRRVADQAAAAPSDAEKLAVAEMDDMLSDILGGDDLDADGEGELAAT